MSEVQRKPASFLQLYGEGRVTPGQIGHFIETWHNSDDSEQRPLAEFLGMTDDEYAVWLASRKALPAIITSRRTGRRLAEVVGEHLADLQRGGQHSDRAAIHALRHWLEQRAGNAGSAHRSSND